MSVGPKDIRRAILHAVEERGRGKTVCPSEVARSLAADWRSLMGPVREEAAVLAREGRITVTRGGETVDPLAPSGPIRLGLPPTR